jgi:SARP family transcriptional regulator, regulator of embCAB operon
MRTRRDRLLASWWILLTLVPFGATAWVALVYAGVQAKNRRWIAWGIVYLVLLVSGFTLLDEEKDAGLRDDVAVVLWASSWIVPFAHSLAIRNRYLDLTEPRHPELAEATAHADARAEARRLAREDPARALELGVGRPDLPRAFDGGLVDLNNAPLAEVERVPGIDRSLAQRIVRIRDDINGFDSLDDLGAVVGLDAPTLDRIRRHVVVLPRGVVEPEL